MDDHIDDAGSSLVARVVVDCGRDFLWSDGPLPGFLCGVVPDWGVLYVNTETPSSRLILHPLRHLVIYNTFAIRIILWRNAVPRAVSTGISPASGCIDKPRRRLRANALTLAPRPREDQGSLFPVSSEVIPMVSRVACLPTACGAFANGNTLRGS